MRSLDGRRLASRDTMTLMVAESRPSAAATSATRYPHRLTRDHVPTAPMNRPSRPDNVPDDVTGSLERVRHARPGAIETDLQEAHVAACRGIVDEASSSATTDEKQRYPP